MLNQVDTKPIYNMIPPEKGVVDMYVKIYKKGVDRFVIVIPARYTIRNQRIVLTSINGDLLDSYSFTCRRAAEIDLQIEKSSVRKINGELFKNNGLMFYEFLQTWLATKENDDALSEGTKKQYRKIVKKIMSHIGNIDIRYIDNYEIVKLMGKIKGADSYRATIRNILADIFSCAQSWHGIQKPEIPSVKVATKTKTILNEGQINLLLSRAGVDYEIWRMLFNVGLRQGEAYALRFPHQFVHHKSNPFLSGPQNDCRPSSISHLFLIRRYFQHLFHMHQRNRTMVIIDCFLPFYGENLFWGNLYGSFY